MSTKKIANMTLTSAQLARKNKLPKITKEKLRKWKACWPLSEQDIKNTLKDVRNEFWHDEDEKTLIALLKTVNKITQNGKIKSVSLIDLLEMSDTMIPWEDKAFLVCMLKKEDGFASKELGNCFMRFNVEQELQNQDILDIANMTVREVMMAGRTEDLRWLNDVENEFDTGSEDDIGLLTKFLRNYVLKG